MDHFHNPYLGFKPQTSPSHPKLERGFGSYNYLGFSFRNSEHVNFKKWYAGNTNEHDFRDLFIMNWERKVWMVWFKLSLEMQSLVPIKSTFKTCL